METLRMEFNNVAGGCSFGYMLDQLLDKNGITDIKVKRNWRNDKNVFIINGKAYIFSESSYIFNYDGVIDLEEFDGATRDLSETCQSSFITWDKDCEEIFYSCLK